MFPLPSSSFVRRGLAALGLLALTAGLFAAEKDKATPPPAATDPVAVDKMVLTEVKANFSTMNNLQHLCDVIGPRLTGSAKLKKANEWTAEKMKEYGLTNVKLEPWEIPVGWERGTASMKLLEPNAGKELTVAAAAWTPGTKGKIAGPVVYIDAKTKDDLAKYKGKLKGAIVLTRPPSNVNPINNLNYLGTSSLTTAEPKKDEPKKDEPKKEEPKKDDVKKDEPKKDQPPAGGPGGGRPGMMEMMAMQRALGDFLKTEGAAVTLRDSAKPHGLLVMTGSWPSEDRGAGSEPLPGLFVTHEAYTMLYRLATTKDAAPPQVEVEISNKFIPGPITVYNTVGEITGSEKPDEFVVVGAHLDSWDLGTGATDNGTGSCTVLETARVLSALAKQGIRPKRTVRFVLFTGEEQGLFGSKQYVKKHEAEMSKTSVALVHDTGTGKVMGFGVNGRESIKKLLDNELVSLKEVDGWKGVSLKSLRGSDHQSFEGKGVPGFACDQDMDEYYLTHHTQSDTYDHAKEPNLIQGAQVMAVTALRIANLPELLPREKVQGPPGGGRGGRPDGPPSGGDTKPPEKKDEKKDEKKG